MTFAFVALGGALGSICRFQMGKMIAERATGRFPWGTFCINILGAFLLGIVSTLNLGSSYYALLGDGFLGAFTTFSTFMYDGFSLFEDNEWANGGLYICCSIILGILGYYLGYRLVLGL